MLWAGLNTNTDFVSGGGESKVFMHLLQSLFSDIDIIFRFVIKQNVLHTAYVYFTALSFSAFSFLIIFLYSFSVFIFIVSDGLLIFARNDGCMHTIQA